MIYFNSHLINGKDDYFPDGTPAFNTLGGLSERFYEETHTITWLFDDMKELFEIIALNDWIKENHPFIPNTTNPLDIKVTLRMPYIPNARMDRVKNSSKVFTLKTFCNLINSCQFYKIIVHSAHSNVSLALLNHTLNIEPGIDFLQSYKAEHYDTIFLPDEGAVKRFGDFFKLPALKHFKVVIGSKTRDWTTGKILNLSVLGNAEDIKDKNVLILDDICSRGGSFKFTATELKKLGAKDIGLFVTHCENVIDIPGLKEVGINQVITTNSIWRGNNPFVKIFKGDN